MFRRNTDGDNLKKKKRKKTYNESAAFPRSRLSVLTAIVLITAGRLKCESGTVSIRFRTYKTRRAESSACRQILLFKRAGRNIRGFRNENTYEAIDLERRTSCSYVSRVYRETGRPRRHTP